MKNRKPGRGHAIPFRRDAPLPRQLRQLAVQVDAGGLTVGELLACLGEAGLLVLCVILATPFLLPVSIPGSSVPFGLLIALIGIGIAAGRTPWLPERLLRKPLRGRRWAKVLIGAARLTLWLEKKDGAAGPDAAQLHWSHGLGLTLAGLLLTLPLPIPFSNTLPGIAVFLLSGGMLRRGRLLLAAGHAMLLISIAYLSLIGILGGEGVKALWHRWISF
jgi:hypothetical protein